MLHHLPSSTIPVYFSAHVPVKKSRFASAEATQGDTYIGQNQLKTVVLKMLPPPPGSLSTAQTIVRRQPQIKDAAKLITDSFAVPNNEIKILFDFSCYCFSERSNPILSLNSKKEVVAACFLEPARFFTNIGNCDYTTNPVGILKALAVREDCRKQGIATRHLDETKLEAKKRGFEYLILMARQELHQFYKNRGFCLLDNGDPGTEIPPVLEPLARYLVKSRAESGPPVEDVMWIKL